VKPPILFIDDEMEMIDAFRDLFQEHFTLFTVQTVEEGLQLLREKEFTIVICDMRMPGMDGADFLEIANSSFRKPIKIILSAKRNTGPTPSSENHSSVQKNFSKSFWKA